MKRQATKQKSNTIKQQAGTRPNQLLERWIGHSVSAHLADGKAIKGRLAGYDAYTIVVEKDSLVIYLPKHSIRYIAAAAG